MDTGIIDLFECLAEVVGTWKKPFPVSAETNGSYVI